MSETKEARNARSKQNYKKNTPLIVAPKEVPYHVRYGKSKQPFINLDWHAHIAGWDVVRERKDG